MSVNKQEEEYPFFAKTDKECLKELKTDLTKGLSSEEAEQRLRKYGENKLAEEEGESIWEKIKEQFEDVLVRILLLSAIISFVIAQFEDNQHEEHTIPSWVEPCVIFSILILNGVVAIYQDLDAEKAIQALKEMQSTHALALRNGKWDQIDAALLVPGDIVQVKQGDKIPADLRVIQINTINFMVNQSMLTGETKPSRKQVAPVGADVEKDADKLSIAFSGTLVEIGSAIGLVASTGMKSGIGKIQEQIQKAQEDKKEEQSPLKQKIDEFGENLAKAISAICVICWLMNIPNFNDEAFGGNWIKGALYYFKVAVALAVAAIPEGLPAVITTCLALGSRRMAKHNAIIRKLPSVETLGCTTVICSDKTGTLTTNQMSAEQFHLVSDDSGSSLQGFSVEGQTYNPDGNITDLDQFSKSNPKNLRLFSECMALCNDSKLIFDEKTQSVQKSGLPTEAALKVLNEKIGKIHPEFKGKVQKVDSNSVEQYNRFVSDGLTKAINLEFTSERKSMSVVVKDRSGNYQQYIKGAPDYLLNQCKKVINKSGQSIPLSESLKKAFSQSVKNMAAQGLRTLAIAYKSDVGVLKGYENNSSHPAHAILADPKRYQELETDPILIGLVGLRDPPRPEVKAAIRKCQEAGISVIMITGDIKETAESIASEIGILQKGDEKDRSLTGKEFQDINEKDPQKAQNILAPVTQRPSGFVFSRTDPAHKRTLVKLLGDMNQIVAMTGDGVNDAPALKQAQIGVAMGITGTEVAKSAADMVLADDNFTTIVTAVEEGRAIYNNMKAFIRYMISSNIGEVVSIFLSSLLGIPDGFNSIQLLWVNLVTDGLPATALSFNPPDKDVMKKPPRKHDEPLISGFVFIRYLLIGTYVGLATTAIFAYWYTGYKSGDGHSLVEFDKLRNWTDCEGWAGFQVKNFGDGFDYTNNKCAYFTVGKKKASTLSLTVLVMIEMFNALNALSDEGSLLQVGIFANPTLILAIIGSITLHCLILYIPFLASIFGTAPLTANDWILVLQFSAPVMLLDEILKAIARVRTRKALAERLRDIKRD